MQIELHFQLVDTYTNNEVCFVTLATEQEIDANLLHIFAAKKAYLYIGDKELQGDINVCFDLESGKQKLSLRKNIYLDRPEDTTNCRQLIDMNYFGAFAALSKNIRVKTLKCSKGMSEEETLYMTNLFT